MTEICRIIIWNVIFIVFGEIIKGNAITGPLLLYSTDADIRILNATIRCNQSDQMPLKTKSDIRPYILVKNVSECAAIDFHYENRKLFWTDQTSGSIQSVNYSITDNGAIKIHEEIQNISKDLSSPDGLACDWISNNIYWTDSETKRIEVASIGAGHRKVLFWTDLDQPRAIAVLPMKGLMFWTDWGDSPKIERAGMNGDPISRQVIVSSHIIWPNGLTIDYANERIYWIDGKLQLFEVMDYNGGNRKKVVSGMDYPFALTQYQNKFYWTDWRTGSIHYYDQSTPNKSAQVLLHSDKMPMDIHVWDAQRQPKLVHACSNNKGGCSHLCLLAPQNSSISSNSDSSTSGLNRLNLGYTCACPIGTKLINSTTCADGPQEILLIARKSDIAIVYLDSPDFTDRELKLTNIKYSIGVDYDPVHKHVYWTDDEVRRIQRASLDGSDQQDVLVRDIHHPDGVAVDAVAGNIYWADTGTDRIEVARLDGHHRRVIIGDDLYEPRAVVAEPILGYLFWSDWYEKRPKIERSNLDGSERTVLVHEDLVWPNGIAVDSDTQRIYWCDAKTDKIEYVNLDGSDRHSLVESNLPHCFGLSLIGDYVYWTDWQRRTINRVHKESGAERHLILEQIENVMGLKAVRLSAKLGTNACSENNGGCEHLCLYRHNTTYVCACEIEYELQRDQKSCVKPKAFLLYVKNSSVGRLSIENSGNDMNLFIPGVKSPSSIDFDVLAQRLYWSDSRLHTIMRAYINGSDVQRVVELGLTSPEGIAIDWITLNLYWADSSTNRIEVARLDGTSRRTLVWNDVYEPHTIALDPQRGYMYWSEWGSNPIIKKAAMDGSGPQLFLECEGPATGLTLDHDLGRFYWAVTTEQSVIYSRDLKGGNRSTVVSASFGRWVGLSVFKDYVYWSDQQSGTIWQVNKLSGQKRSIHTFKDPVTDLLVFSALKQNVTSNQCAVGNGGCSHLCLVIPDPNSTSYTCACPTHYTRQNKTCIPPTNFMIYSQKNLTVRLLPGPGPGEPDCLDAVLPIQGLKGVKAIDFDPGLQFLYWIEGKTHAIKRAKAIGLHISTVIAASQDNHPFDLALDAIGRLLFWSCSLKNVINVTRLENGSAVGVIVNGEKPRLIAIHPTKRLIFYTDIHTKQLIRIRMDGTQRFVIKNVAVAIEAIAVDIVSDLVFWSEGQSIYMCNIDGDNLIVALNETNSNISQLTVHNGYLYWLDRKLGELKRFEITMGKSHSVVLKHIGNVVDLISVRQPDHNHKCYVTPGTSATSGNRPCSHFCLIEDDGSDKVSKSKAVCSCPNDQSLQDDARTCVELPDCGPEHFSCVEYAMGQKECIPITWRCDGQNDCNDKSDEDNCPTCRLDQYRCQNSQCIEQAQYCDGIDNCDDRSDELKCCKLPTEFRCPRTDVCIATNLLCDGMDNCADGADERPEVCANTSPHVKRDYRSNYVVNAVVIMFAGLCTFLIAIFACYFLRRKYSNAVDREMDDHSHLPLNPLGPRGIHKSHKLSKGIPDLVHMSMMNNGGGGSGMQPGCSSNMQPDVKHSQSTSSYDRNHITGASSSTNDSSSLLSPSHGVHVVGTAYPPEPLNPPPSPATTAPSSCLSGPSCSASHNSRQHHYHYYSSSGGCRDRDRDKDREKNRDHHHRPYRYYRSINQPPPPTPCSTDVCDDSEYNYPLVTPSAATSAMVGTSGANATTNTGANGMFPPPPTPRSHCHSESCPPSPSSRSSTYFSPLPPPPSPVPSTLPPHYDVL